MAGSMSQGVKCVCWHFHLLKRQGSRGEGSGAG